MAMLFLKPGHHTDVGTRETPAHTIMVQEGAQAVEAAGPDFAARFDAAQLRVLRGADGSNGADGLMVTRYYAEDKTLLRTTTTPPPAVFPPSLRS